jgi:hypothetical protein
MIYFPRNWEFGSALSKLRNFGGEAEPPQTSPLGTPLLSFHFCRKGKLFKGFRKKGSPSFTNLRVHDFQTHFQQFAVTLLDVNRWQIQFCRQQWKSDTPPQFRSFSPNVLPQTAKNIAVELGVHGLALGGTRHRTVSTFLGVDLVKCRPELSSSSTDVLPLLKCACHSKHLARLMASFPYACRIISKGSAPDLPSLTQNLMFAVCSSFTSMLKSQM